MAKRWSAVRARRWQDQEERTRSLNQYSLYIVKMKIILGEGANINYIIPGKEERGRRGERSIADQERGSRKQWKKKRALDDDQLRQGKPVRWRKKGRRTAAKCLGGTNDIEEKRGRKPDI